MRRVSRPKRRLAGRPLHRPYTTLGIRRVPCARCGKTGRFQWQSCALDNRWHAVCGDCDVLLNKMVLLFFRVRDWRAVLARYVARIAA